MGFPLSITCHLVNQNPYCFKQSCICWLVFHQPTVMERCSICVVTKLLFLYLTKTYPSRTQIINRKKFIVNYCLSFRNLHVISYTPQLSLHQKDSSCFHIQMLFPRMRGLIIYINYMGVLFRYIG